MPPEGPAPGARQLLLPFEHATHYDHRDFLPAASNRQALAWLDTGWPDNRLALWGPPGCGKSHLLHIWAERAGARLLAGHALSDLDGVPDQGALALDDADCVGSEALLLHLLNTARDRGLTALLAGRLPPSRWPAGLPDLSSRLRAIAAVEIRPPDDELLAALLMRMLSDRQLKVTPPIQQRLLRDLPRSPEALRRAVALLDNASLCSGKPINLELANLIVARISNADEVSMSELDPSSRTPRLL